MDRDPFVIITFNIDNKTQKKGPERRGKRQREIKGN
jgi:hypothetical protein